MNPNYLGFVKNLRNAEKKVTKLLPANIVSDITTTTYDRVLAYLKEIKSYFNGCSKSGSDEGYLEKVNFIINAIQNESLYKIDYCNIDNTEDNNENEIESIIGYINSYSNNDVRRKGKRFQTTLNYNPIAVDNIGLDKNDFSFDKRNSMYLTENNQNYISLEKQNSDVKNVFDFKEESRTDDNEDMNVMSSSCLPIINIIPVLKYNEAYIAESKKVYSYDIDHPVLSKTFDIFKYTEQVGDINLIAVSNKFIFTNLDELLNYKNLENSKGEGIISFNENNSVEKLLDFKKLNSFSVCVREKYLKNYYHNHIHGADVLLTLFQVMYFTRIVEIAKLNTIDVIAILLAGLVHDIGHPGFNNNFMINSKSDLTITYNDQHVLENFHTAEGFKVLSNGNTNILSILDTLQLKYFRKRFIQMVLSTDPSSHTKVVTLVKNKLISNEVEGGINSEKLVGCSSDTNPNNYNNRVYEEQQEILDFLISFADTSHSCKSFEVTFNWSTRICEEFWHQGDVEKELMLPVSFLCDRKDAFVGKGQIGFIQAIIMPGINVLVNIFPELDFWKINLEENIEKWADYLEKREELNK